MPTVRMAPGVSWDSIMSCLTPATAAAAMMKPMKPNTRANPVQMPVRLVLVLSSSIARVLTGDSMSLKDDLGRAIVAICRRVFA